MSYLCLQISQLYDLEKEVAQQLQNNRFSFVAQIHTNPLQVSAKLKEQRFDGTIYAKFEVDEENEKILIIESGEYSERIVERMKVYLEDAFFPDCEI